MTLVKEFGLKYRGLPTKGSYLLRIFANLLLDAEVGINLLDYSINVNIFFNMSTYLLCVNISYEKKFFSRLYVFLITKPTLFNLVILTT